MQEKEETKLQEEEKPKPADLDSEISSEINFLQEKIKERPVNKKKLIRRTVITVVMAMVFGLVACVTFSLLEPVISKIIYPEKETGIVRFPEEEEELNPEDMAVDDAELQIIQEEADSNPENDPEQDENAVLPKPPVSDEEDGQGELTEEGQAEEEIPPEELAKMMALENHLALYQALGDLKAEIEKSMVTVTTVTSDVNWINDIPENTGTSSGLIVADNGRELLILADYAELKDKEKIAITFWDTIQAEAAVKEVDTTTGLTILSVPLSSFTQEERENITYASLGSSLGKSLIGQPVMAIGSPAGVGGSISYGMVTSQGTALGLRDSNYKLLMTDIYGSSSASGVIANMQGQIVGILYNDYENPDMQNQLCAIGITELKRTIEKLSNGEQMVYLGIHGAEMNTSIYDAYKLPRGAYVRSIDIGSPAMSAGVQSGDIITKINNTDILSHADLVNFLMQSGVGQTLTLNIARQGQAEGEYQEMTMEVVLKEQPRL